jgi:hypothetical protein
MVVNTAEQSFLPEVSVPPDKHTSSLLNHYFTGNSSINTTNGYRVGHQGIDARDRWIFSSLSSEADSLRLHPTLRVT